MITMKLSPDTDELPPAAQRTIRRALAILTKQLREPGVAFTSTTTVRNWLRLQMATLEREEFTVLFLDNQHRLITFETLFTGSINRAEVYPRELVKSALKHNAAAVILSHNHPSGYPEPSDADRRITVLLQNALALMEIHLLDHLVIGGTDIVSFAERGWL